MEGLPYELLFNLLLDVKDIGKVINMCATNSSVQMICDDDFFWKKRFELDFPLVNNVTLTEGQTYKLAYQGFYLTGIGNILMIDLNLHSIMWLIKPSPPYTIEKRFYANLTELGGEDIYIFVPDIRISYRKAHPSHRNGLFFRSICMNETTMWNNVKMLFQ